MITRAQMPRQLRDKGGIASVIPREKYGIGSTFQKFKDKALDRTRKLIPNELADIAVKAAPFVAPFSPKTAALMRGIGRFDQRGSLSDAFKQGLGTYAFGVGARKLGGAENVFGDFKLSSPLSGDRTQAIKGLFEGGGGDPKITPNGTKTKNKPGFLRKAAEETIGKVPVLQNLSPKVQEKLLAGTITSGASALYSYFTGEFEPQQPGETVGEYLARRNERVKLQMRQVMDSYYTPLRNPEYAAMTPEQKDNFIDGLVGQAGLEGTTDYQGEARATGGRVGYQTGGITMANTLAENIARNRAAQSAFQQAINPSQQKIVERLQKANPTTKSALEKFADHARVSEAMKGKTGMDVIPEYALQTGADFQKKFSNVNPKVSAGLAAAYQTLQEGSRAILDGPGGVTLKDAYNTALDQTTKNIEGILAADTGTLTAKQQADRNKYLASQGQPTETTPTPDAGSRMVDGVSQEGVIPGFKKVRSEFYNADGTPNQEKIKAANFIPGSSPSEFYYERIGEEGGFGPVTYSRIAAGQYPDIYDPNKTLPVEPQTDQDLIEGFAKFKEQNPEVMQGAGTMAIVEGTLPDGTPIRFSDGVESSAFNKYLESLGLSRADIVKPRENIESLLKSAKLAKGGMPTGIMKTNKAGVMERDYRDKGGFVPVGIKEKADDVPAMLSKNEFVFTADAVRGAGNGSIEKGAQRMYDTMKNLERRVT